MTSFFLKIYDLLQKHRKVTAFTLFVLLLCFFGVTLCINYEEDISKFLPRNEKNEKYAEVYQNITSQNRIAVIFAPRDTSRNVSSDSLESSMELFGKIINARHVVKNLQVSVDESKMLNMVDFIGRNYSYFLTPRDYKRIDSLLASHNYISQQMEENKKLLMLPMVGSTTMQTLQYDPLHLFTPVLKRLQSFQMSSNFNIVDGYIFTKDGKRSMITFNSPYGASETRLNANLAVIIDSMIAVTEKVYPNIHVSAIGAPLIAVTNANQIKTDSVIAVSIAVVLILLLLILHYRRLSDIIWICASLVFGWLFALAGMAAFKDSVSIIVLGIGSVIIGISVNYPLHFLDHLKEVSSVRTALKEMVPPLLIGNVTTVAAFLCLVWLDADAMRDLGVFGSLMLIGTILFVLVFLPLFVKKHNVERRHLDLNIDFVKLSTARQRRIFIIAVSVITIFLGWLSFQTSFDSDLRNINYMTSDQRQDLQFLSSSTNESPLYAVAEGKDLQSALVANDSLRKILERESSVMSISGISNFVPSSHQQTTSIANWSNYWGKHRDKLINDFNKECARQGFAPGAFRPFTDMIKSRPQSQPLGYFSLITSILASNYILKASDGVRIVNYVNTKDNESVESVVNDIDAGSKIYAFSSKDIGNQLVSILNNSFNYIGFVCGFVVFFFLWISFARIELSLMSFLPLAVSWLWILGLMQFFGIQFNIVNIILATFIFGQGDDYTIFITEGLIYEYAYGRERLASYKRSVALSAILMFIGIGTLILARHPALRSLAEVTIIGMITVVFMAYYLPPIIFRWITTNGGNVRQVPLTLKRICFSLFSMLFFLFTMYLFVLPWTWIYFRIGRDTEVKKLRYHRFLQRMSHFVIHRVPGVDFSFDNSVGENFSRPAVIICNHQSHLDLMCLMMLTPKMVFLTNDWVWNNPFYGMVIHRAEFYPVSDGIDKNIPRLQSLYDRGYSIAVFPEGTRSPDSSILRFHKGAFYLAQQLQADILPIFIHGNGHVLPKRDFMLREGRIHVEIQPRVKADDLLFGNTDIERRSSFHKYYLEHYAMLCTRLEDSEYFIPFVRYQYMYKGTDVESRCRKILSDKALLKSLIDAPQYAGLNEITIGDCGQGEIAYLFALVHKKTEVYAYCHDEDDFLLVSNMANLPANLHFLIK